MRAMSACLRNVPFARVEQRAEPPVQRWVKHGPVADDRPMAHLLTLLSGTFLTYVGVTRGSLAVSCGIAYIYARAR